MKKWSFLFMLVIMLCIPTATLAKEIYIPLGDSIAAGQTPNRAIDTGYTDLIALKLAQQNNLQFYSKELTFPGYKVENVIARMAEQDAKKLLKNATIVTISAGANDLLQLVQHNPKSGTLSFSQVTADFALNNVRKNYDTLLKEVQKLAPNAKIYIIGYYFPYPHVHAKEKVGTTKQLQTLNTILERQAKKYGATYIEVDQAFAKHAKKYVPNSADVHPTMEGYLVMANAFLQQYNKSSLTTKQLPKPNPIPFEELMRKK